VRGRGSWLVVGLFITGLSVAPDGAGASSGQSVLVWTVENGLSPDGRALLDLLQHADREGLDPADYGAGALADAAEALEREELHASQVENMLWSAVERYARHRCEGRLDVGRIHRTWSAGRSLDIRAVVAEMLARGQFPAGLVELDPPYPEFAALRSALHGVQGATWEPVAPGGVLRPGKRAPKERLDALAHRLGAEDEACVSPAHDPAEPAVYGSALEACVRRFQDRHGLVSDGVVGSETGHLLTRTREELQELLGWNLDRWRWMPRVVAKRGIRVNVAAFDLALLETGRVVGRHKVIAGKRDWPTPPFRDGVKGVMINPDWTVPASIIAREILPEAAREPGTLAPYEVVVDGPGTDDTVDWTTVDPESVHLRQPAGPDNPLGTIKLLLGNDLGIYLHDTPARGLFARVSRAFSHGCIRVERPMDVAAFASGQTPEVIAEMVATQTTRVLPPAGDLEVVVGYWTAWVDPAGVLHTAPDVYGYDGRMARASPR
jgi:murein L,D-transpeptidase YcbB/YkuD